MKSAPTDKRFPDNLPPVWREKLKSLTSEVFFKKLTQFLKEEYQAKKIIYPARENVLRALQELDLPKVKVVILGQDPYHGPRQAIGLSFAVPNDLFPKPPSLKNIFKELQSDLQISLPEGKSDLSGWVKQGVLLLNTVLTVEAATPLSHRDQGWEAFTDRVLSELNARENPLVFVLWGSHAQKLKAKIDLKKHAVLESVHPSPLSAYRGFFGSKVFSKINQKLIQFGETPIDWSRVSILDHT
jgi:uracil-DNA glycosylase